MSNSLLAFIQVPPHNISFGGFNATMRTHQFILVEMIERTYLAVIGILRSRL